ncbi:MAG: guanylate kinase [Candidatus ainarchaeum sp.]|nr:guanylate kinase [Candidatus ainarchaeum sp.]
MPKIFVISGHSGSGKTTIANSLLKKNNDLEKVITCTTRKPRNNEINGKDYFFLTLEEFEKNIKENLMAEYEKYSGNYYGSRKKDVEKILNNGKKVLFVVDTKGALTLKKSFSNSILIFIKAPSLKELKKRLLKRGDKKNFVEKRFLEINDELKREKEFDFVIINNILEKAIDDVQKIIK